MPKRWRKRTADGHSGGDAFSNQLRLAQELILGGQVAEGLAVLNTLAGAAQGPVRRSQVLAMVAYSQMRQGKFADASATYETASVIAWNLPTAFLRPAIGQVLSLLRNVEAPAAATRAREVIDQSIALAAIASQNVAAAAAALAAGGSAQAIAARPPRPSVVARRFGRLFLAEGEVALATEFLNRASILEPAGASGGRITLAEIALREGNASSAVSGLLSVWRASQPPKVKTLSAIPLLVRAATTSDAEQLSSVASEVSAGLATAKRRVRARGVLLLVRALRDEHRADLWIPLANAWISSPDSTHAAGVAAEIRKLTLSDARIANKSPADAKSAASALLSTKGISPYEFLAAAKELVRSTLFLGTTPDVEGLLQRGQSLFGAAFSVRLLQGLAIASMMAKRHDVARPLLQRAIATAQVGSSAWGRAVWALARMETVLGRDAQAATGYKLVGNNSATPARFRLKAKLEWAKSLVKAGDPAPVAAAAPAILAILAPVTDYETLLDFARQLCFAPAVLKDLQEQVFARGEALAEQARVLAAADPVTSLTVLFKLTRRRDDLFKYSATVAAWESLSAERKLWLWTARTEFWELLSYVYKAYFNTSQFAKAETLFESYSKDPATPSAGAAILAVTRGLMHVNSGQMAPAMVAFKSAVARDPSNLVCAHAYYWLALDAWIQNLSTEVQIKAENILRCIGPEPSLQAYWVLEAKALCLQAGLDVTRISPLVVRHSPQQMRGYVSQILEDMQRLAS